MRLFVAIEVGASAEDPGGATSHLTLRFLGEVAPDRLPSIGEAVRSAASASGPYDLVLEGVGAFPSRAHPRVVWLGATVGEAETRALAERVAQELERAGFPPERERFVPHLTLFRVRGSALYRRAVALLSGEEAPPPSRRLRVESIVLKESTLTPHGALHRTLSAFPLGAKN